MHKLAEIASYPGNPPAYASIMVFDGMFVSVSNRFWLCSFHNGDLSPTRPARSRPRFGLHYGPQLPRSHLSCNCRRVRVCCITKGLGSYYPRGSGCLTRPPRDDSLTFKNRSESWCAGLGQEYSRRKDVPKGGLRQLAETQVQ